MLENLLWHLHLLQIQQYTAIKTLLLDIPYMSIRIILNLLVYNVSYMSVLCKTSLSEENSLSKFPQQKCEHEYGYTDMCF